MLEPFLKPEVLLSTIISVIVVVLMIDARLIAQLKEEEDFRNAVADMLQRNAWLKIYQDRLRRALEWLNRWMGSLNTWSGVFQSFNVCMAVSAAYTALFFIFGWMFGGPGSVGNTQFLPSFDGMAQRGWGAALVALAAVVGIGLICGKSIDARCEARMRRLAHFGDWLYRLGGAILAATLWLAAGFNS